jgi:D-alanine-D-alanine ligase
VPQVTRDPYERVDWSPWRPHKANLHSHTTASDGTQTPGAVIDEYQARGYDILAITDHDTYRNGSGTGASTWPWTAFGRDPDELGMLAVRGNEFSGIASYDHYVVAHLELVRQPYTGCNPRGMMLSRDKVLTKQLLAWHRIATPDFQLFPYGRRFHEPRRLAFPLFVKSATEDASLGIAQASVVDNMRDLRERVEFIHDHVQTDALVEEYIDGRELYIGVLGNKRLTTLPVWELDFGSLSEPHTRIATRKAKWDRKYQERHTIATGPARALTPEQSARLAHLAKRTYRALHMSGYARLDLRMRADGKVFLLEANANPDLTYGEDFAESASAAGMHYPDLIQRIVNLGLSYMPEWRMFEA